MRIPFWLAKLLGRADGDSLATCEECGTVFARQNGLRATGAHGLMCSDQCVEEAVSNRAW